MGSCGSGCGHAASVGAALRFFHLVAQCAGRRIQPRRSLLIQSVVLFNVSAHQSSEVFIHDPCPISGVIPRERSRRPATIGRTPTTALPRSITLCIIALEAICCPSRKGLVVRPTCWSCWRARSCWVVGATSQAVVWPSRSYRSRFWRGRGPRYPFHSGGWGLLVPVVYEGVSGWLSRSFTLERAGRVGCRNLRSQTNSSCYCYLRQLLATTSYLT